MSKIFFSLLILLFSSILYAQPCSEDALLKISGTWKKGNQGSIENVKPDDLSKEKQVLDQIYRMINGKYTPFGCNISYSTVFGYNQVKGKNWKADPYEIGFYVMNYSCNPNDNDINKHMNAVATGTTVYVNVNRIWSKYGNYDQYAAGLPDDHHYPGYSIIHKWPEKKNGHYFWQTHKPTERENHDEYQYLITYDGKLPFKPFSRKEYLMVIIPELKKKLAESERYAKERDPNFDAAGKRGEESALEYLQQINNSIIEAEAMLKNMSPEELNKGAEIGYQGGDGLFHGFAKGNETYIQYLVKPDMDYYRNLPKWVPQFITVLVNVSLNTTPYNKVFKLNIDEIEKAIDFDQLRKMLGNSSIITAANASAQ